MISLQTNADSINAQNNLSLNGQLQSKTIQQLTSGYRINRSGDDAAGLAVANAYRNSIAEMNQGLSNANDGVSQLQIVDGGLGNISTILDRMKTLATQSASTTFTGSRATLDQEYQKLVGEITRQADSINLGLNGSFNQNLQVFVGGTTVASNASVSVDLSGATSAVDASSLGLTNTNLLAGGSTLSGNTTRLDAPGATFVVGTAGTNDQTFNFSLLSGTSIKAVTATVKASAGGSSLSGVLSQLNGQLNQYGINASVNASGLLEFSGATAFTVHDAGGTGTNLISNGGGWAENTSLYNYDSNAYAAPAANVTQTLSFSNGQGSANVSLASTDTETTALQKINTAVNGLGIYAFDNNGKLSFQSASNFSINDSQAGTGTIGADSFGNSTGAATQLTATAPRAGDTSNAQSAIDAINSAIQTLGDVQGKVGAGENTLGYAISLLQSQITNFSSAQSQIRDANVAAQASNLTKSQVLVQTSIAALAQANSEPQAVLKLLQG
jgi:flagellin